MCGKEANVCQKATLYVKASLMATVAATLAVLQAVCAKHHRLVGGNPGLAAAVATRRTWFDPVANPGMEPNTRQPLTRKSVCKIGEQTGSQCSQAMLQRALVAKKDTSTQV